MSHPPDCVIGNLISEYNLGENFPQSTDSITDKLYIKKLEDDLVIAGKLGKALLEKNQSQVDNHRLEKEQLVMEVDNLKHQIDILFQQNQQLLQNNDDLLYQSVEINESLFTSDKKIDGLNDQVSHVNDLSSRLNFYMSQSNDLESEISLLETSRDDLETKVENKDKEKRSLQIKYNKATKLLNELTSQYQTLEDNFLNSQNMSSSFVSSMITENSKLQKTVKTLSDQLESSRNEIHQLKSELKYRKQPSSSTLRNGSTISAATTTAAAELDTKSSMYTLKLDTKPASPIISYNDIDEDDELDSGDCSFGDLSSQYHHHNEDSIISDTTEITIPPTSPILSTTPSSPQQQPFSPKSVATSNISIKSTAVEDTVTSSCPISDTLLKPKPSESILTNASTELNVTNAMPQTVSTKASSKDLLFAAVSNNMNNNTAESTATSSTNNTPDSLKRKPSNWSSWLRMAR